jgi:hypothetical protein
VKPSFFREYIYIYICKLSSKYEAKSEAFILERENKKIGTPSFESKAKCEAFVFYIKKKGRNNEVRTFDAQDRVVVISLVKTTITDSRDLKGV